MLNVIKQRPLIATIDNLLSYEYCDELIAQSERQQYELAQITIGKDEYLTDTSYRNNDRIVFTDEHLAHNLFKMVQSHLPQTWDEGLWEVIGLNERFRYYRYQSGQTFKPHFDGCFERRRGNKSFLTLLFYLNDDFIGGETKFYRYQSTGYEKAIPIHVVRPQKGQALIFDHRQVHEGSPVTSGVKYVLRTDVMYRAIVL